MGEKARLFTKSKKKRKKQHSPIEISKEEGASLSPPVFDPKSEGFRSGLADSMGKADDFGGGSGLFKLLGKSLSFGQDKSVSENLESGAGVIEGGAKALDSITSYDPYKQVLGNIGKYAGLSGKGFSLINGNFSKQDAIESGLKIGSEVAKSFGKQGLARVLGGFAGNVNLVFAVYQIFENFFGSLGEAKAEAKYRNFRVGFSKGIAVAILGQSPKSEFREERGGRGYSQDLVANSAAEGNNLGLKSGFTYGSSIPPVMRDFLFSNAIKSMPKGGLYKDEEKQNDMKYMFQIDGSKPTVNNLSWYLMPLVDDLFAKWKRDKKIEKEKKAKEAREKAFHMWMNTAHP